MFLTVCSLLDPGSIPGHGGVFQGIFLGGSHTLEEEIDATKIITSPFKR